MRHAKPYRKLSRQRHHYNSLMQNLALGLFEHGRIRTTTIKAKEARRFVDQILTLAKGGSLADRRRAFALLGNKTTTDKDGERQSLVKKIFGDVIKAVGVRSGGYTRIIRLGHRPGDAAPMCYFELVGTPLKGVKAPKDGTKEGTSKPAAKKKTKKAAEAEPVAATA